MEARKKAIYRMLGSTVHVEVDRPIGHVHKGIVYPINYGYIPGILAGDGQEQDAYILGVTTPLTSFDGQVIGAVCRRNDVEDKLIVAPVGADFHQGQIAEAVHFQEQYFDGFVLSLFHKSCGVLPWRRHNGVKEYLIVFERYSQCWSLPKGHMEAGETEVETAQRELLEETGLTAELDATQRAVIEYPLRPAGRKQVVFFAGQVNGEPVIRPGEITSFKWVLAEELQNYLFPDTVETCQQLIEEKSYAFSQDLC